MKPKYAIAALAAAAITALGGSAALAATASHQPATITLTPVSGKPVRVVPGHARPVSVTPEVAGRGCRNAPVLIPVSGKPTSFVPGHVRPIGARPVVCPSTTKAAALALVSVQAR